MKTPCYFQFIDGPLTTEQLVAVLDDFQQDKQNGAVQLFLGRVRADQIEDQTVQGIEYSCYHEMAEPVLNQLMFEIHQQFHLDRIVILHSLGYVAAGQTCLLVLTASGHRREAVAANKELVERLKKEVPVWGKELFEQHYQWKQNT